MFRSPPERTEPYREMTESKELWLAIRQALLMIVDAIEKQLDISPTTSEMRKQYKSK